MDSRECYEEAVGLAEKAAAAKKPMDRTKYTLRFHHMNSIVQHEGNGDQKKTLKDIRRMLDCAAH